MAKDNQNLGEQNPHQNQNPPSSNSKGDAGNSDVKNTVSSKPQEDSLAQQNGQGDKISNDENQPVSGFKLGPTQIGPNLAKEDEYSSDQNRGIKNPPPDAAIETPVAETPAPEMEYPSSSETNESSFNPKLIAVMIAVILFLGGAAGGAFYLINKSNTEKKAEEETNLAEEKAREEKIKEEQAAEESKKEESASEAPKEESPSQSIAPPAPQPVEQPKIETPQPPAPVPDNTGAVNGSG